MLMTTTKIDCPEPGVYAGVDFSAYDSWDAISNSGLGLLAKSPRHFHEADRSEATDAQRIGELCHCNTFEPGAFAERYAIMPPFERDAGNVTGSGEASTSKATKYYRAKKAEFEAANAGREICPAEWYEQSMTLVRELSLNERAHSLLSDDGPVEVSIVWDELVGETQIRCKARIDKVALDAGAIVDLKKCREVAAFERDIAYRKYNRQLVWYVRGWAELHNGDLLTPWLIAHESTIPMAVVAAPLSEIAVLDGHNQVEELLAKLAHCIATDDWPGPKNPSEFSIPEYLISEPLPFVASNGRELI